ncbi:Transcriptional regulator, LysR family [Granulibacter bethesdensis]|uniref:Transcriptional regulator, LysR family n=1 Tax=Granulibacter bethesdensis TaxID=364410 RepID=A0AAN0RD46_9PROT|nr:LysR family transcriptional regulator [Granulibacter bethesdensis]AHJ62632.1 Transcriptional regulator, LysR family [Granulibacter bethesdensis]
MDMLATMQMFVRVVEFGSFSRAAGVTGVHISAISRGIASLEENLGVDLFHRSTRRVHLTEPGRIFYQHARSVLREVEEARAAASAQQGHPQGLLRLALPDAFARLHIVPHMPEFLATYPDIRLDMSFSDVRVDLIATGADAAIRIGPLLDSSLIARKLAPHRRIICASPDYLENRPAIRHPEDLVQHNCLIYSLQPSGNWFFHHPISGEEVAVPVRGSIRADDSEPLRGCALSGLGIVLLPTWLVGNDLRSGRLSPVLPDWNAMIATQPSGIFGLYPPHRQVPPKIRAFLDFLQTRFGRPPYWEQQLDEPDSDASS